MNTPQEAELLPPTTAVAVREPQPEMPVGALAPVAAPVTAAQAKVDAIGKLTMDAYQRASQLMLTDAEIAALGADFPDEAFKPGAAGKESLIYIEHAFLRERLNSVFRPGQWAIVPRNRWAEDFKTQKNVAGVRVYVEAMLCIRGCFAGEAVGEMEYYPSNGSQNYGDCVEGAKTAALRRCCKEIGIGLQAWKKDWCEGWWQRKRGHSDPARRSAPAPAPAPAPKPAPAAKPSTVANGTATAAHRERMVKLLAGTDNSGRQVATEFMQKLSWLMPNEAMEDLPLQFVPTSHEEMDKLIFSVQMFAGGEAAVKPYEAHAMPLAPKPAAKPAAATKPKGPAPEPTEPPGGWQGATSPEEEPWRSFPMPYGKHAGVKLADLDKKYLFGLWANHQVETEYNGRPRREDQIQKDQLLRDMLDKAGEHYEFTAPSDND